MRDSVTGNYGNTETKKPVTTNADHFPNPKLQAENGIFKTEFWLSTLCGSLARYACISGITHNHTTSQ